MTRFIEENEEKKTPMSESTVLQENAIEDSLHTLRDYIESLEKTVSGLGAAVRQFLKNEPDQAKIILDEEVRRELPGLKPNAPLQTELANRIKY